MRLPRQIIPYGNDALLLKWEQKIAADVNAGVHAYASMVWENDAVIESVPAYCSLLVRYNASKTNAYKLKEWIYQLTPDAAPDRKSRLHKLAVVYGGEYGPDLETVASQTGLSTEKVIELHQKVTYRVYQLGYKPGFAFLGETLPELAVSRRDNPRSKVPAGSVGLAGQQTAVYPHICPGGWQLIGRCPATLWDVNRDEPARLQAGDRVKFHAIDAADWEKTAKKTATWKV